MDSKRRVAAIAAAYRWASRCFSIVIGMLVPGFLGYWADTRFGTTPVLLMLGFAAGFAYGLWRLVSLLTPANPESDPSEPSGEQ